MKTLIKTVDLTDHSVKKIYENNDGSFNVQIEQTLPCELSDVTVRAVRRDGDCGMAFYVNQEYHPPYEFFGRVHSLVRDGHYVVITDLGTL